MKRRDTSDGSVGDPQRELAHDRHGFDVIQMS